MFYGRIDQLNELNSRFNSTRKQLIVIYGRRRIGKTELVKTFLTGKQGFIFQAVTGDAMANLKAFSNTLVPVLNISGDFVFSTWEDALREVALHFSGRRYCLVIDEYPFIAENFDAFPSILQAFYDSEDDNLNLILLGSDISFLKKELRSGKPLYMRKTCDIELDRMPLGEALLFLEGLSTDDKFNYLSLMSTYPFYLSTIDKSISFDDNVINLLFNVLGEFAKLPDILIHESDKEKRICEKILRSIIHGHQTAQDIKNNTKLSESEVLEYSQLMSDSKIIEETVPFMGSNSRRDDGNQKNPHYCIVDPMLRFWYIYIDPNKSLLKKGARAFYMTQRDDILHRFITHGFEDTAILYLDELNAKGELVDVFSPIRRFEIGYNKLIDRSVEIDGLACSDKFLLVVECKYTREAFSNQKLEHLKESASIFNKKLKRQYYIFSKAGFAADLEVSPDIHCITLEDMIGSKPYRG